MRPSTLTHDEFLARFGPIYEDSPWVADSIWPAVEQGDLDDLPALAETMRDAVDAAPHEAQLALIRAHPQLAVASNMAKASVSEQHGAGLDRCSPEELAAFQRLNLEYLARFGFPFIVAVAGLTRSDILAAFTERLSNEPVAEFAAAIAQIHRIAGFRLAALFASE